MVQDFGICWAPFFNMCFCVQIEKYIPDSFISLSTGYPVDNNKTWSDNEIQSI